MADQTSRVEAGLIADLNDLLQLDHDAVQAYDVAIRNLSNEHHRQALIRFRGDHERHIEELTRLIREHGGVPIEVAHIPTGVFKLAVQKVGAMGGDREILLAFKANERQSRDKYRKFADMPHPERVREVLERAAEDEARHYAWALETLDDMGAGPDTLIGRAEDVFEQGHKAVADAVERVERRVVKSAEAARRSVKEFPDRVRSTAGSGLENVAGAVNRAGDWAERHGGIIGRAGAPIHQLAGTVENAAGYVRSQDFGEMRADLECSVHGHPLRSVLVALGAGFLLGRILR